MIARITPRFRGAGILLAIVAFLLLGGCKKETRNNAALVEGVDEIVLFIQGTDYEWLREAVRCHGIEEKCADEQAARSSEYLKPSKTRRNEYIAELKRDYADFPPPLHKQALQEALSISLRQQFKEPVRIIVASSRDALDEYLTKKNTLIAIVKLLVSKTTVPHIATLRASFYRHGLDPADLLNTHFYDNEVVIPLDLPEAKIAKRAHGILIPIGPIFGAHGIFKR